jgi:hypothetical protein
MTAPEGMHNETDLCKPELFQTGDMALILRPDGSVRTVAFDVDTSRLMGDADKMTDADERTMDQGQKLFALTIAANSPMLMNILLEIAANPDIVDEDALKQFMRPN